MSLEEIEKKLYSREKTPSTPSLSKTESFKKEENLAPKVEEKWSEAPPKIIHRHKKGKGWLFALVIFFLAVIGMGIYLIFKNLNVPTTKIEISLPSQIFVGIPFKSTIIINNNSDRLLSKAYLTIDLPSDVLLMTSQNESKNIVSENLGDIEANGLVKKTYTFVALADESKVRNLKVRLSYQAGWGASFEKEEEKELNIKKSPISLMLNLPAQTLANSVFDLEINYQNNSDFDFPELNLELNYPLSFKFISSDPQPTAANNFWQIKSLGFNRQGKIKIKGLLTEGLEQTSEFRAVLKTILAQKSFIIGEQKAVIQLAKAPLQLAIFANNASDYTTFLGDEIHYRLDYQNNSGVALSDNVIKAKLIGELFDISSLSTDAYFSSLNNTLTWNAANTPALRLLNPNDKGSVEFSIKIKKNFPIQRLNDKNFHLRIEAEMDSPTVPYYLSATKTSALANLETKVQGQLSLEAKAYFRDASSGVLNTGPFPPRVNQATNYSIHWLIKNYANDISKIVVRSFLESGVVFSGVVKSNVSSQPTYNSLTQELILNIDKIAANKGVVNEPVEVIFQIQATPNINQVNRFQPLLKETQIEAHDDYTGKILTATAPALTTRLPFDSTVSPNEGLVQP